MRHSLDQLSLPHCETWSFGQGSLRQSRCAGDWRALKPTGKLLEGTFGRVNAQPLSQTCRTWMIHSIYRDVRCGVWHNCWWFLEKLVISGKLLVISVHLAHNAWECSVFFLVSSAPFRKPSSFQRWDAWEHPKSYLTWYPCEYSWFLGGENAPVISVGGISIWHI